MATHDDVARRWVSRCLYGQGRDALKSANLHDHGDQIYSYGTHFEVGRVLRDKGGNPAAFLLNGNTYSVTTSRHQAAVRAAVTGHGLPVVTIPHAALLEAGIELSSVQILDVQRDWNTTTQIVKYDEPGHRERGTRYEWGGWQNSKTGEFVQRMSYSDRAPRQETCDSCGVEPRYGEPDWWERRQERETHIRLRHGEWEEVRGRSICNGHVTIKTSTHVEWEIVDDPDSPTGLAYVRDVHRHWLGASLIKATVNYQVNRRHKDCSGTGVADQPWYTYDRMAQAIGPLTQEEMYRHDSVREHYKRRLERGDIDELPPEAWSIDAYVRHNECRGCSGRGRVRESARRTAYFLSGFDENERRPSYFFCELAPKARPTTVEEALESLKPDTVKLAESLGREVKRQGDIFAIPMPTLTLAQLKAQGGTHVRRPKLVEQDGRLTWSGPRPTLLGTNHEATEVVRVGKQTYARGTITHNPERRRPDHARTTIGKQWHLILKNTVPTGA